MVAVHRGEVFEMEVTGGSPYSRVVRTPEGMREITNQLENNHTYRPSKDMNECFPVISVNS